MLLSLTGKWSGLLSSIFCPFSPAVLMFLFPLLEKETSSPYAILNVPTQISFLCLKNVTIVDWSFQCVQLVQGHVWGGAHGVRAI